MTETVKPKNGLQLKKVGNKYMLVKVCNEQVNLTDVFRLNETAARLWQWINEGNFTPEELAGQLCDEYETDHSTALADIRRQLAEWKSFGLVE